MLFAATELIQLIYQFFNKKSKIIGFLGLLAFAYIMGYTDPVYNLDYSTYSQFYSLAPTGISYFENGYTMLGEFFWKLGFNYANFRAVFSVLIVIVLFLAVSRFTKNISFFVFTYGITVFLIDVVQIRNLMSISLVLLALSFLAEEKKRYYIIAILLIYLAGQFQTIGYVFIPAVVFRLIPAKYMRYVMYTFIVLDLFVLLVAIAGGNGFLTNLLAKVAGIFQTRESLVEKVTIQYVKGVSRLKALLVFVSSFSQVYLSTYLLKNLKLGPLSIK